MKEKIIAMLKSPDIEMVRLGALLLRRLPRKDWTPLLRQCQSFSWNFEINYNRITIKEALVPGTFRSTIITRTHPIRSGYPLQSYTFIVEDYNKYKDDRGRDYDEERKRMRDKRAEKLRRQSIKYKRI